METVLVVALCVAVAILSVVQAAYGQFSNPGPISPPAPAITTAAIEDNMTRMISELNQTTGEWKARNIMVNEDADTGQFTIVMLSTNQSTGWVENRLSDTTQTYGFDLLLYDLFHDKWLTVVLISPQPEQIATTTTTPPLTPTTPTIPPQTQMATVEGEEETTTTTTEEENDNDEQEEEEEDTATDNNDDDDNDNNNNSRDGPLDDLVEPIDRLFDEDPNNDPEVDNEVTREFDELFGEGE